MTFTVTVSDEARARVLRALVLRSPLPRRLPLLSVRNDASLVAHLYAGGER